MVLAEKSQKPFSGYRWLATALALLVAVVILASFVTHKDDVIPVHKVTPIRGTIRSVISTNGKVEPVENFEAHAPAAATVLKLLVREGDHVKQGQLLLQLDDAEARSQAARALAQLKGAQADVNALERGGTQEEVLTTDAQLVKARTELDAAQRNYEALKALQQKNAASPGEVRDAQNNLQRAQAEVNLLQQKQKDRYSKPEVAHVDAQRSEAQAAYDAAQSVLAKSNVRAPFDGVVYSLPVKQGAYVQPGDLLLQEADLSKVLVRAYVDEPDIGRLSPGNRIEVTWDAIPGRKWEGTLSAAPSTVKVRGTRNVGEATCVVANPDFKLLPNVNVGITIVTAEDPNALILPREAVRSDDGKPYVYQIVDNTLKRRNVQTALSNLTSVEIASGLGDGAAVAVPMASAKSLRDGAAVKIIQ
jgi:HlyD family secretion protein